MTKFLINIGLLAIFLKDARCDLPVHCISKDEPSTQKLHGYWHFHVSKEQQEVNLFKTEEVCTHRLPNKVQAITEDYKFGFATEEVWRVAVLPAQKTMAILCQKADTKCLQQEVDSGGQQWQEGKWFTLYDQALNVEFTSGTRFLANFRYHLKPEIVASKSKLFQQGVSLIDSNNEDEVERQFMSQCDQTMIGFVQNYAQGAKFIYPQNQAFPETGEQDIGMVATADQPQSMKSHRIVCFWAEQVSRSSAGATLSQGEGEQSDSKQQAADALDYAESIAHAGDKAEGSNKTAPAAQSQTKEAAKAVEQKNETVAAAPTTVKQEVVNKIVAAVANNSVKQEDKPQLQQNEAPKNDTAQSQQTEAKNETEVVQNDTKTVKNQSLTTDKVEQENHEEAAKQAQPEQTSEEEKAAPAEDPEKDKQDQTGIFDYQDMIDAKQMAKKDQTKKETDSAIDKKVSEKKKEQKEIHEKIQKKAVAQKAQVAEKAAQKNETAAETQNKSSKAYDQEIQQQEQKLKELEKQEQDVKSEALKKQQLAKAEEQKKEMTKKNATQPPQAHAEEKEEKKAPHQSEQKPVAAVVEAPHTEQPPAPVAHVEQKKVVKHKDQKSVIQLHPVATSKHHQTEVKDSKPEEKKEVKHEEHKEEVKTEEIKKEEAKLAAAQAELKKEEAKAKAKHELEEKKLEESKAEKKEEEAKNEKKEEAKPIEVKKEEAKPEVVKPAPVEVAKEVKKEEVAAKVEEPKPEVKKEELKVVEKKQVVAEVKATAPPAAPSPPKPESKKSEEKVDNKTILATAEETKKNLEEVKKDKAAAEQLIKKEQEEVEKLQKKLESEMKAVEKAEKTKAVLNTTNVGIQEDINLGSNIEKQVEQKVAKEDDYQNLRQKTKNLLSQFERRFEGYNSHAVLEPSPANDNFINWVNNNQHLVSWQADTCKLQKQNSNYNSLCDYKSLPSNPYGLSQADFNHFDKSFQSLSQVDKKMQLRLRSQKKSGHAYEFGENTDRFKKTLEKAQKWAKTYASPEEIPDELIPKSYNFKDLEGYDFTSPVRDQGACGSCYTTSFVQVIESRQQLVYGNAVPQLSMQFLLQCNYMNEGCEGGWPLFNGYLAENGYLVTEDCAPYFGNKKIPCSRYENCAPAAKVKSSYFLGGGFGQYQKAKQIQKELLRNGPVIANMLTPKYFKFYQTGTLKGDATDIMIEEKLIEFAKVNEDVKKESEVKKIQAKIDDGEEFDMEAPHDQAAQQVQEDSDDPLAPSKVNGNPSSPPKEKKKIKNLGVNTDHSVVIIGWGNDEKTGPYWIVRNSFGRNWGLDGDFQVAMGLNDFGIEEEVSAFEVRSCDRDLSRDKGECVVIEP